MPFLKLWMLNIKTVCFYFLTDFFPHIMQRWMTLKFLVFHRTDCIINSSFFCGVLFFGLDFVVLFQTQHTHKKIKSMTKIVFHNYLRHQFYRSKIKPQKINEWFYLLNEYIACFTGGNWRWCQLTTLLPDLSTAMADLSQSVHLYVILFPTDSHWHGIYTQHC